MKLLWRLVFGKRRKRAKPEKKRKNLGLSLLDGILSAALAALELKFREDLWKPGR